MGTEILGVFILIPVALWLFGLVRIIQRKNTKKHAILILIGVLALGYMSLSSYLGGWSPMQGFIIGSVFYGPGYIIVFVLVTVILKKTNSRSESSGIT